MELVFEYVATGDVGCLHLPGAAARARKDGLWQHTCFEVFLLLPDGSYFELNFAPSGEWASYRFDAYREGMAKAADLVVDRIELEVDEQRLAITATVSLPIQIRNLGRGLALSAVIEETDGTKSYWALAHPPGKPDFHHPACFAATLAAPEAP